MSKGRISSLFPNFGSSFAYTHPGRNAADTDEPKERTMNTLAIITALLLGRSCTPTYGMKDEVPVAIFTRYAEAEADRIVGDYLVYEEGNCCKVRISREADGTYSGKVFWVENMLDPKTGEVLTDVKNPDKSLRDVPIDRIVLFSGMKYNAAKGIWDSAQIYHPVFGIKANATARFDTEGNLLIRGSVLGIGKTVSWKKL